MVERTREFQRNQRLEDLICRLGDLLAEAETRAIVDFKKPELPIVLVHGCARSGTTLLMQVLAETGVFAYPSNLISRFYKAPYIGALIQLMLTDKKYHFRNEFIELENLRVDYDSNLGKTRGILSPNEFNYFWREFFDLDDPPSRILTDLSDSKRRRLLSELASLEITFGKPLAMKGIVMNWHIAYLAEILDTAMFVHVKRNTLFNAQSMLEARKKFYGDISEWYSLKPCEYALLMDKDPVTQVIGQVIYTNEAIQRGLDTIPENRRLSIDYEYLCKCPNEVVLDLMSLLSRNGYELKYNDKKKMNIKFDARNKQRVDNSIWGKMEAALKSINNSLDERQ